MWPGCSWKTPAWLCNLTAFCIIFNPEYVCNVSLRNVNIHLEQYSVTAQTNKIVMRTAIKHEKLNKKCRICKMSWGNSSHCRYKQPKVHKKWLILTVLIQINCVLRRSLRFISNPFNIILPSTSKNWSRFHLADYPIKIIYRHRVD